jgi:hypothetical protein
MSTKPTATRVRAVYEFIKANRQNYSVQAMCRLLGYSERLLRVARAAGIKPGARRARLVRLIRASFTASGGIYGAIGPSLIVASFENISDRRLTEQALQNVVRVWLVNVPRAS